MRLSEVCSYIITFAQVVDPVCAKFVAQASGGEPHSDFANILELQTRVVVSEMRKHTLLL